MSIIDTYFTPLAEGSPGAAGLKDDAGYLEVEKDASLVLTTDAIVEGVHYLAGTSPQDVGYKALAVNVSDLCAKGANPSSYLLTLALSGAVDPQFLEGLQAGLSEAQKEYGCCLLGGDTVKTDGPTLISISLAGMVPANRKVHRSGAKPGDLVYVTGTIGDASLGLSLFKGEGAGISNLISEAHSQHLRQRYLRPNARLGAIPLVRNFATASMDISDGLIGDFEKLAAASSVGGTLQVADIPLSDAAAEWLARKPESIETVITGGDDYEVLMTISPKSEDAFKSAARENRMQVSRIGQITPREAGVSILAQNGELLKLDQTSYDHF